MSVTEWRRDSHETAQSQRQVKRSDLKMLDEPRRTVGDMVSGDIKEILNQ